MAWRSGQTPSGIMVFANKKITDLIDRLGEDTCPLGYLGFPSGWGLA
ncbi:hypothetical protein N481_21415 [Pseudoalteromonas luteoviolacea S4047-1]|uniref:Uncharacterized protein n=1 Tax=Pseudoalteromonas luteoviolacea S4054 TaxID=1129367 RepID=A0A0F6A8W8_9GAMM|nr:hypothetical protein N479_17410 [Pseudoalteromonas luteoviolacea S4054]KZN69978.1 hypothetical protein N481_21415 [Pseudoalteromonas luteoviolacea S4047-1]